MILTVVYVQCVTQETAEVELLRSFPSHLTLFSHMSDVYKLGDTDREIDRFTF